MLWWTLSGVEIAKLPVPVGGSSQLGVSPWASSIHRVWCWQNSRKVWFQSIFSRKTSAFGQKQYGRGQRCPQGNHPTCTNVVKFQASTRDPRDESSASSTWHLRTSPYTPRTQSGKTSDKKTRKEKEKHRCQEQTRKDSTPTVGIHAPNVASTTCKDLSHVTCFNSGKKGHYRTKYPKPRKNRGYSQISSANEFRVSVTLPPSKKYLCQLYLTQEVRSMPYTLPLLRN